MAETMAVLEVSNDTIRSNKLVTLSDIRCLPYKLGPYIDISLSSLTGPRLSGGPKARLPRAACSAGAGGRTRGSLRRGPVQRAPAPG